MLCEIQNPNSCGQGFAPRHAENPHHSTLTQFGWQYSHTTPITAIDGSKFAHHTYRFPGTDHCIGVDMRPGYRASAGMLGSGFKTTFYAHSLRKYCQRKARELRKLAKSA